MDYMYRLINEYTGLNSCQANVILIYIAVFILICCLTKPVKRRLTSSNRSWIQALGMALDRNIAILGTLFIVLCCIMSVNTEWSGNFNRIVSVAAVLDLLVLEIYLFNRILRIFGFKNNDQKDSYNHKLNAISLFSIGVFLVYVIVVLQITKDNFLPFSLCAALLGLLFQDAIKGIVAYYHLRSNGLLRIGDMIEVKSCNIEGIISDISLVTVTVSNTDNTTSNISLFLLQLGSFKNKQDMLDGKKTGRQICRDFPIDTHSIKSMDMQEVEQLEEKLKGLGVNTVFFKDVNKSSNGVLNIYIFRMYIRYWLMNHSEISQYPHLVVRLMEPTSEGLPLQVFTYTLKCSFAQYELVQSEITEHVMLSMEWFGLKLYQSPSGENIEYIHRKK